MSEPAADIFLQKPQVFHKKRILVAGDIALDRTFLCDPAPAGRHAVHAGESIVDVRPRGDDFGTIGAAYNAILLATALGAESMLATVTGDDPEGDRVADLLTAERTAARQVRLQGVQTVTRLRFFVNDEATGRLRLLLRVDKDPNCAVSYARAEAEVCTPDFLDWWEQEAERSDAVLFSDTGKGFLSRRILVALNERTLRASDRRVAGGAAPIVVVVDPKREWEKYFGLKVDVFKPNAVEAAAAVGLPLQDWSDDGNLLMLGVRIAGRYGIYFPTMVITLGENGAALVAVTEGRARLVRFPALPAAISATGIAMHCGDLFASALALSLCVDHAAATAIPFANYVGSLQVNRPVGQKVAASDLYDPRNLAHFQESAHPPQQLGEWLESSKNPAF
jgi:D-beta-D-heptose 7-phosphate kinase/D-beta-D-heptose 1-phosphate adenosyltransferase